MSEVVETERENILMKSCDRTPEPTQVFRCPGFPRFSRESQEVPSVSGFSAIVLAGPSTKFAVRLMFDLEPLPAPY